MPTRLMLQLDLIAVFDRNVVEWRITRFSELKTSAKVGATLV